MWRWAPVIGIGGVAIELLTVWVLGPLTPGVDPVHGYISTIGLRDAPYRELYVLAGTLAAAAHIFLGLALLRTRFSPHLWAPCGLLIAFSVVQWLGAAVWPCEPGCAWTSVDGRAHYGLGLSGFFAFGFTLIFFSAAIKGRNWPYAVWVHRLLALGVVASLALLAADRVGQYNGLMERIVVFVFAAWNIVVALGLRDVQQSTSRTPPAGEALARSG